MPLSINDLAIICSTYLGDDINHPGSVLYSGETTLTKGDFYFLGFNPGGAIQGSGLIKDNIALSATCNAFLDEKWSNKISNYSCGQAPLQRRVDYLLKRLGANTREVCASNIIFMRSPSANALTRRRELAEKCWNVHLELLKIVNPRVILCHGRATFDFVATKCGASDVEGDKAGHGSWTCRRAALPAGRTLLGVPHLSRYDPFGKEAALAWLRQRADRALLKRATGTG